MHVRVLLPEDLCNRSPGFSALVVQEETPSPLPVIGPTDGLMELTRQDCAVVAPGQGLVLLLSSVGGPALPGGPFHLGVPHQTRVQTLLQKFNAPRSPGPDLSGPADAPTSS